MSDEARMRWLCRRGMKELDLLLTRYFEDNYPAATEADRQAFRAILEMPDPELNDLILGRMQSGEDNVARVISDLRATLAD
jgi:antitoxin CptB